MTVDFSSICAELTSLSSAEADSVLVVLVAMTSGSGAARSDMSVSFVTRTRPPGADPCRWNDRGDPCAFTNLGSDFVNSRARAWTEGHGLREVGAILPEPAQSGFVHLDGVRRIGFLRDRYPNESR